MPPLAAEPTDPELCALARGGNRAALDLLCRRHLPMVMLIASRTARRADTADVDDLTQVGLIALCKAARNFDPGRGRKFVTVGWVYCENAMRHHLRVEASQTRFTAHALGGDILGETPARVREVPEMAGLLDRLDPVARRVVTLSFGFEGHPLGPRAVADRLGLSVPRVKAIMDQAIATLRGRPAVTLAAAG